MPAVAPLTPRWRLTQELRTPPQEVFWRSDVRFNVCHAGRRSGKTEIAKMRAARKAIRFFYQTGLTDGLIICGAPTHKQARNIFWRDMLDLIPRDLMAKDPLEGLMSIQLIGGTEILVAGLDVAARAEGRPIDHLLLDEYGNMKPEIWTANLRPALSTPGRPVGTADFVGVPEGRNHYFDLCEGAKSDTTGSWLVHHWFSEDVVAPEEIAAAKRDLDPLTYEQEYRGSFVSFQGKVYYQFDALLNTQIGLPYHPNQPIAFCLDFNRKPGVAVIVQEQANVGNRTFVAPEFTAVIGEMYIHSDSNTELVCRKLIEAWGRHPGDVYLYGDATGGNRHTASLEGSDWEIVRRMLSPVFGPRLKDRVPRSNPAERARVNAMNSRLKSFDGTIRMLVDPQKAPKLIKDFEGVRAVQDGSGRIDKTGDLMLTHSSDALGYYVVAKFPVTGGVAVANTAYG